MFCKLYYANCYMKWRYFKSSRQLKTECSLTASVGILKIYRREWRVNTSWWIYYGLMCEANHLILFRGWGRSLRCGLELFHWTFLVSKKRMSWKDNCFSSNMSRDLSWYLMVGRYAIYDFHGTMIKIKILHAITEPKPTDQVIVRLCVCFTWRHL